MCVTRLDATERARGVSREFRPWDLKTPPERVLELAERLPCPLLVDEAYVDFADVNCLGLAASSEKILVSRSMSKSYALAGVRFGFVVAQPHVIRQQEGPLPA